MFGICSMQDTLYRDRNFQNQKGKNDLAKRKQHMEGGTHTMIRWVKLYTDMFDNKKIKQIKQMPEGKAILLVWIQLIVLAGQTNDQGAIYFTKEIAYNDEMLANHFDEKIEIVRGALGVFQRFGMLEIVENIIYLANWEKYQAVEGMEKIREQTRVRVARFREKEKAIEMVSNVNETLVCNGHKNKSKNKNKNIDMLYIVEQLNQKANTNYKSTSKKTQDLIQARANEGYELKDFVKVISNKCDEWGGTEMAKYLRPETLFGTKFESYLNQKGKPRPSWLDKFEADEKENDIKKKQNKKPINLEELEKRVKETFKE